MTVYRVTFVRKTRKESDVVSNQYSEGAFREITLVADSEKEAKEIAKRVQAKQFPTREEAIGKLLIQQEGLSAKDANVQLGPDSYASPINAHTNYKLQGVVVLPQEGT